MQGVLGWGARGGRGAGWVLEVQGECRIGAAFQGCRVGAMERSVSRGARWVQGVPAGFRVGAGWVQGVPAGFTVGAGFPGCKGCSGAPRSAPSPRQGARPPRSADSLARPGPPRWPGGRKRKWGDDTRSPPPSLRVVVRWRKDGGGHRVSGGGGTQRRARAVSAASASSRLAPGPTGSLPG